MLDVIKYILIAMVATAAGGGVGLFILGRASLLDLEKRKNEARTLIEKSTKEAEIIKNETLEYVQKKKATIEHEVKNKELRTEKMQTVLSGKEGFLDKKLIRNKEIEEKIKQTKRELEHKQAEIKEVEAKVLEKLAQKTGRKTDEIKAEIMERYKQELDGEMAEKVARYEDTIRENADKLAQKYVVNVLQRLCSPTSVETRSVNIIVPKDHIKGKIVGKDGQNIKELEGLIDVDVIFNDLPNTISISAFQLVERRVAQKAIEKLVNEKGTIDKAVVHRAVRDARKATDDELYDIGYKALKAMKIKHDDKELCRITGRLQYRTSYGQNIMKHSMEVGWVASMLGSELGLNEETCRIGGFLHDVGKAIDQDPNVKDAHDHLSKEIMEKHGFSWEEVHAAWTHHDAIPQETAEALIVKAADAISAGRPGARQESFDKYIERIMALEETATTLEGVKKAYAISAGRELRVNVDAEMVGDDELKGMAEYLAKKIEEEIIYPGKIKVNVIRRTKHTEIAK